MIDEATGNVIGPIVPITVVGTGTSIAFEDLASDPCTACATPRVPDLGDAPDSTNHFDMSMTAYSGVQAEFPTVYDPDTGLPQGPKHWFSEEDALLGDLATEEVDADLRPDEDGWPNIDPPNDAADRDGADDGVLSPIQLPHCDVTQIVYKVTVFGAQRVRFTNMWFDFNRDGDWSDTLTCTDGQGRQQEVPEWAVQDAPTSLGPGNHSLPAVFRSFDPSYPDEMLWARVTLADAPAGGPDGRGISGGYEFGETEDYFLVPTGSNGEYELSP